MRNYSIIGGWTRIGRGDVTILSTEYFVVTLTFYSDVHCVHSCIAFSMPLPQNVYPGGAVGHRHGGWCHSAALCAGCKGLGADPLPQVVPAVWRSRGCKCPHCNCTVTE